MTDSDDAYAVTTESYRKIIEEQALKIDLLRNALVTCKADWVKALLETKRMRAALKTAEGLILVGQTVHACEHIRAALGMKEP